MKRDTKRLNALILSLIMATTTLTGCGHQVPPQQIQGDKDVIYVDNGSGDWIPYYLLLQSMQTPNYHNYHYARYSNGSYQTYTPTSADYSYMKKNGAKEYNIAKKKIKTSTTKTPTTPTTKTPTPAIEAPTVKAKTPTIKPTSTNSSSVKSFGSGSTRVKIGG